MKKTNEIKIHLGGKKYYFPGETLRGQVALDISKPINVQHISLTFKGLIEGQGEKVVLIDESKLLALPSSAGQKFTVFRPEDSNQFDFEFKIPENNNLPSSVKIPKVADIQFTLTATHKKPIHKLSQTLSTVVQNIKLLDLIDVELPQFSKEISTTCDIGFLNNIQLTQWNMKCPRSAFIPGEVIPVQVNIQHLPIMNKPRALKVSFIQVIYKTNSPKIIDKKIIAESYIDVNTVDKPDSQSFQLALKIPSSTPPTVFPLNGRIISVSYVLGAELNMKGVRSTIQFKEVYSQESIILVGTYSSSNGSVDLTYNNPQINTDICPPTPNFSKPSLESTITDEKSYIYGDLDNHPLPISRKVQRRMTDGQFTSCRENDPESNTNLPILYRPLSSTAMRPLGRLTEEFTQDSPRLTNNQHIFKQQPKGTVFMDSLVMMTTQKDNMTVYAPHEIGPHDVICKKPMPDLLRQDTVSTSSTTNDIVEYSTVENEEPLESILDQVITEKLEDPILDKEEICINK